jgi:hypothetical protein
MGGQLARAAALVAAVKNRTIEIRLIGEPVFMDPLRPSNIIKAGHC